MKYTILKGENLGMDFLPKIMDIDKICYQDEYVGELSQMEARYKRNEKSFVCVMDGEKPIGYINFFPVCQKLWDEIVETGMTIRDDDIQPEELADYSVTELNHIFILSIAILPEYRKEKYVIKALTDGFIDYLNDLEKQGIKLGGIAGTAVSGGGQKCLERWWFRLYREIEDGNKVYLCEGASLKKFLENDLYIKSFQDDLYMFLPYADNAKNSKINPLFDTKERNQEIPEIAKNLLSALDNCQRYEYQSVIVNELERVYLGEFRLLCTIDEYPKEENENNYLHIAGEETVYISMLAHRITHMYILQLFIPNCCHSTTQLEDQLSQGYLKIRKPDEKDGQGFYVYKDLNTYLKNEYGLLQCGKGKSILCMSNKPQTEKEFYNILTAETFKSFHQDFQIDNEELKKIANDNHAVYDYYEIYMTEVVFAFILNDFMNLTIKDRIDLTATYIFIVELVIFQNTALNKMTIKVSNALTQEGDTSYQYINQLYHEYAKTMQFWESDNFKYYGTQVEAEKIREAFENDELRRNYYEQQEFLEHMVDLTNAQHERRNGMVINIVAIVLALLGVQSYLVDVLSRFYEWFGIPVESATSTFDVMVLGGGGLLLLVWYTLNRKTHHLRKKKLSRMVEGKDR